ncbi:hypothetical protein TRFO_02394 [Tritrichomonas foetus]|uniref:Uncharacterized protein n=1 Tax=Tritrichomonas foetus TaxID=1144522 RepID=A0A1J4J9F4_9EUKA|nr:hypothetical protein TRFO_02394 [Tritrichomonas foetus]|eukprot:OHS93860.1 hypothetical protein TRFO_02394 [Tritrichomonas foetus]
MNTSNLKVSHTVFRTQLLEEFLRKCMNYSAPESCFNIENQISLICDSRKNLEILRSSLQLVMHFYTSNSNASFELLENPELLQILVNSIKIGNDEKIREFSFKIIFIAICQCPEFLSNIINFGLFQSIAEILHVPNDGLGYYFSTKILTAVLSYSDLFYQKFKESPIPAILLEMLSQNSEKKLPKTDIIRLKDYKIDNETKKIYSSEKKIIKILRLLYNFCGNDENGVTHLILTSFVELLNHHHDFCIKSINECLKEMIISSQFARNDVTNTGLLQYLNFLLNDITYDSIWVGIFDVLYTELVYSKNDPEQIRILLRFINPKKIFNVFIYKCNDIEKEYSQKVYSSAFNFLSLLLEFDPSYINRPMNGISLEEIEKLLFVVSVDGSIYELKENGVNYILHLACYVEEPGYAEHLFAEYGDVIANVLFSCSEKISEFAINTLLKLSQNVISAPEEMSPIHQFFNCEDFCSLMEQWRTIDDINIQQLSYRLYSDLKAGNVIQFEV